ncbi:MAG: hypothetical protein V2A77_02735 [Pseudomonadota bacterium]
MIVLDAHPGLCQRIINASIGGHLDAVFEVLELMLAAERETLERDSDVARPDLRDARLKGKIEAIKELIALPEGAQKVCDSLRRKPE